MFACVSMTPFGEPVEPDVYCRNAMSVGAGDLRMGICLKELVIASVTIHSRCSGHAVLCEEDMRSLIAKSFFACAYDLHVSTMEARQSFAIEMNMSMSFWSLRMSGG